MAAAGVAMYSRDMAMPVTARAATAHTASAEKGRSHAMETSPGARATTRTAHTRPPAQTLAAAW